MAIRFNGQAADDLLVTITFSADIGTFMCWVRLVSDQNTWSTVAELRTGAGDFILQTTNDGTTIMIYDGQNRAGTSLSIGQWYHLCCTTNSGAHMIYLDGVIDLDVAGTARTWTRVMLGDDQYAEPLDGRIGAVKAWNAELTIAEVNAERFQYVPVRYSDLVGFWPILGSRTQDFSGAGNDFTESGTNTDEDGPPIVWDFTRSVIVPVAAAAVDLSHVAALSDSFDNVVQRRRTKITSF